MYNNNIITAHQHGFTKGRSTSSNLIKFSNDIVQIADQTKSISIVYTDLRKAFDGVPHDLLILKLRRYGITGKASAWLRSFLTGRRQRVCVGTESSEFAEVESGVPQGGVLSGLLFSLYINDLPLQIQHCNISLYADDAKIYTKVAKLSDIENMQQDINRMIQWCKDWRLTINPGKCNHIQYNPRSTSQQFSPTYYAEGREIEGKRHVRDLGIIISEDLKFHAQVDEACRRAHNEINRIRRTFVSRSPKFLGEMYRQFVRPHMEYCIEVWNPKAQGDINKMERVQNKMTRMLNNGNRMTHDQRNSMLGISSHEQRRLRGDLINIYKNIANPDLFTLRNNDRTRGHEKTLILPRCNTLIKKSSFGARSINEWNSLPNHVVMSENLNVFKRNIDKYMF